MPAGKIKEFGHYTPVGTTASAAYFATKDIVYVMDYQRGLDIIKLHDGPVGAARCAAAPPASRPTPPRPSASACCPA